MQTPTRSLKLHGASNFRDLGGYVGQGGRSVRWRRLFRSDHLGALSADDVALLSPLGLTRVCDFRGVHERVPQACAMPGVAVHALSIEPTVVQAMATIIDAGQALTPALTVDLMRQTYRDFVRRDSDRFAELFDHLLDNDAPLVFHCTAGKDRTGLAAALVLLALGVSRDLVLQDYLLTNELYRQPASTQGFASQEVLDVLWRVQQDFLDAALDVVASDYGSVAVYLERALGVGPLQKQRLTELYLQP